MTNPINLTALQEEALKNPIAKAPDTNTLVDKINDIKNGIGYTVIAQSIPSQIKPAIQVISNMTSEDVTPILLDTYKINHSTTALKEYRDAQNIISKNNELIYTANTVDSIAIENTVSFGDMFSIDFQNYNVSSHMKIINDGKNISELEKNNFIKETINPIALEIDLNENLADCVSTLSKNKADMIIFKMTSNSKQKLGLLLENMIEVESRPVFACHVSKNDSKSIKEVTTEFIESCRERGLHPGAFVYDNLQDEAIIHRLADDLTRFISNKNKTVEEKEVVAKNLAWS